MVASNTTRRATNDHIPNLHKILKEAFKQYKDLTGEDLATHSYAAELDNWDSVDAILKLFQGQAQGFNESRKGNKKLLTGLTSVVQTVIAVSGPLGDALGGVGPKDYSFRFTVL